MNGRSLERGKQKQPKQKEDPSMRSKRQKDWRRSHPKKRKRRR